MHVGPAAHREGDGGDHHGPQDPGPKCFRGGHGVRDHEAGEQQQGPVHEAVAPDIEAPAQVEHGAQQIERGERAQEGEGGVDPAAAQQHHQACGPDQKDQRHTRTPLTGTDPRIAGERHGRHDAQHARVEDMLAIDAEQELGGDGHRRGKGQREWMSGVQQDAQAQPGDARALQRTQVQPVPADEEVLDPQRGAQQHGVVAEANVPLKGEDAVEQEASEKEQLEVPGIAKEGNGGAGHGRMVFRHAVHATPGRVRSGRNLSPALRVDGP